MMIKLFKKDLKKHTHNIEHQIINLNAKTVLKLKINLIIET